MARRPVATHASMARALANADEHGRALMIRLAAAGSGRQALAVFTAAQQYTPEDAAAAIGCDVPTLNAEIEEFNAATLAAIAADRARRLA